jgi:hypothetical protein
MMLLSPSLPPGEVRKQMTGERKMEAASIAWDRHRQRQEDSRSRPAACVQQEQVPIPLLVMERPLPVWV